MTGDAVLPDLILVLNPGSGTNLVAHRHPDGTAAAGLEMWPSPVPAGALLLHWPARFPWTPTAMGCAASVREMEGVVLSLSTVLRQINLPAPRSLNGLLGVLEVGLEEIDDPAVLGESLVTALGDLLAKFESEMSLDPGSARAPRYRPRPEILCLLPVIPEEPGVYVFHAAEERALYVGKAASLRARVGQHFASNPVEEEKSRRLSREAERITWETTGSELEALLREHAEISERRPVLNTMERVHSRKRGTVREERVLLVLPSVASGKVEVCLVSGRGAFHWERVAGRGRVPRGLWNRLRQFLAGELSGWAPRRPEAELSAEEMAERAEIVLSWMVRHPGGPNRIDLKREQATRDLARRVRRLLNEDPEGERVEVL